MGDPSDLRFIPASSAAVPIDWSKIPEASRTYFLESWGYDWAKNKQRTDFPATLGDLVKVFDECKFFGYMMPPLCQLLLDINNFGLDAARGNPVGPRFYMKYLDRVHFLLFTPGDEKGVVSGCSAKLPYLDDEDEDFGKDKAEDSRDEDIKEDGGDLGKEKDEDPGKDEDEDMEEDEDGEYVYKETATDKRDKELAEEFDKQLEREIANLGTLIVLASGKLAGWDSQTFESILEESQLADAMMSLPWTHPAKKQYMNAIFSTLGN